MLNVDGETGKIERGGEGVILFCHHRTNNTESAGDFF